MFSNYARDTLWTALFIWSAQAGLDPAVLRESLRAYLRRVQTIHLSFLASFVGQAANTNREAI